MKERVEELESSLQSTREWKEMRDELLRLKIEKNSSPAAGRIVSAVSGLHRISRMKNARPRDRMEEAKRRAKELFQQLLHMLETF